MHGGYNCGLSIRRAPLPAPRLRKALTLDARREQLHARRLAAPALVRASPSRCKIRLVAGGALAGRRRFGTERLNLLQACWLWREGGAAAYRDGTLSLFRAARSVRGECRGLRIFPRSGPAVPGRVKSIVIMMHQWPFPFSIQKTCTNAIAPAFQVRTCVEIYKDKKPMHTYKNFSFVKVVDLPDFEISSACMADAPSIRYRVSQRGPRRPRGKTESRGDCGA